jgi:serine/threonine protein kinase
MEAAHLHRLNVQVFRAECTSGPLQGSEVAVKVMKRDEDPAGQQELQDSFAAEWLVCQQLGLHPNLMTVHDRVVVDGAWGEGPTVALVMPLLRAGDLFSFCAAARGQARRALDVRGTLKLLCQMVRGLAHMHAQGLVHGDLKPGNVMLAGDRDDLTAVIGDFGMASQVGSERYVPGTTAYNPPEVHSAHACAGQPSHCISCYCTGFAPSHVLSACVTSSCGPCMHHRLRGRVARSLRCHIRPVLCRTRGATFPHL